MKKGFTMSRFIVVSLMMMFALNLSVAQNIDGKWKGMMEGPNGSMELTFTFKVMADTVLTGTVESPMGELPITNGKKNGKTFSFDVTAGDFVVNHQCTWMTDSISMKVPGMPGGDENGVQIILKRVVETK